MSVTQYLIGGLLAGAPLLYFASKQFSKLEIAPEEEPGKKKISKAEKKAKKKAADTEKAANERDLEKEAAKEAAAERKREKERAKKAAKREKKKLAEAAAAATAEAEAAAAKEANGSKEENESPKKKKKKKKAKKPKQAEAEDAAPSSVADDWTEVKSTKGKKPITDTEEAALGEDDKIHEEIDVDAVHFKTIIGKGGATLQAIQKATNTEIDVPKSGGVRRSIILTGYEAGIAKTKDAIFQLVEKGYCSLLDSDFADDVVDVGAKERSSVIGPGGAYIRAIQERTGTKIQMPDRDSDSNLVKIVGPSDGVKMAMTAVKELISTGISTITHEGHTITKMAVPRNMIMYLIGEKGSKIRSLQEQTGTKINIGNNNGSNVEVTITGPRECIVEAQKHIAALMVVPEPEILGAEWTLQSTAPLVDVW